jgi:Type I phosphodiesterase / nucleotide pyrophosphatase
VPDPVLPAYGRRSLAEVMPAALAALGLGDRPGDLALEPTRAVVVLLVDGLGHALLHAHAADAPFLSGLTDLGPLTVGFPSSTAVSIASLGTGLPPGAHGMLGTAFLVDDELLDALRWTAHGSGADLRDELPPERVQPRPTAFERAQAAGVAVTVVSSRAFRGSGMTRASLRGGTYRGTSAFGDLAAEMISAARPPGRALVYGYHGDLDLLGHLHGPGSEPWRLQLTAVDRLAALVASGLPAGTLLLVTGDHGMVTVDRTYDADLHEDLRRGVVAIGGDPRSRHVYTAEGAAGDVLATWRETLGDDAWVKPRDEAVAAGWFGPAVAEPARIGDVVAAARGTAGVIRSDAEQLLSRLPGQHGSLTADEQLVPLLVHRT